MDLKRDLVKYVRDRAKSKYQKSTECFICGSEENLDFHHFYGLTNVGYDDSETFRHEHQAPYDFLTCDQTELKIVVRSNPGLVLLKEGVVVQKWAWKDIPDYEDLKDNLIK